MKTNIHDRRLVVKKSLALVILLSALSFQMPAGNGAKGNGNGNGNGGGGKHAAAPTLIVSPGVVAPAQATEYVLCTVTGFRPNSFVNLDIVGPTTDSYLPMTDANGSFSVSVSPYNYAPGYYTVNASQAAAGNLPALAATEGFEVQ